MSKLFCTGTQDGIVSVTCQKCGTQMTKIDDEYWECQDCGFAQGESGKEIISDAEFERRYASVAPTCQHPWMTG